MRWKIGKIRGIQIVLHWSLIPLAALSAWMVYRGGLEPVLYAGYPLAMFFVLLHELGHCIAAQKTGSRVRRITLTGIGGIAEIGVIVGRKNEAIVTIAGPATNLVFIIIALLLLFLASLFGADLSMEGG